MSALILYENDDDPGPLDLAAIFWKNKHDRLEDKASSKLLHLNHQLEIERKVAMEVISTLRTELEKERAAVEQLKRHLNNLLNEWEVRFDQDSDTYSYESMEEYLSAATCMHKLHGRKNYRIREVAEKLNS